ncbi:hypothetical protein SAMN02745181_0085 [Rubritalea squalenifaciens DSM 18772]|uniref:Uncharacterized protein n=1 Tax=Rubritalea squalenifaciens DSM 18772 TaxID=1123071 RepID=A0A1M6B051_9BACT|nr:hypothetical protein [Rubritalea squalenifaciens]SHI42129.1 hypothetical protein SAMN02745181_0085 [Rubritalea squalenifaciens DSM 18772]
MNITQVTLALAAFSAQFCAGDTLTLEQVDEAVTPLVSKTNQHEGRVLYYEGRNNSQPEDLFLYQIYQAKANTWEMAELKLLSKQKVKYHISLFAGKADKESKLTISFINHHDKVWAELKDIERINSQVFTVISTAGELLVDSKNKVKEEPLKTYIFAGIRNGNISFGSGFSNNSHYAYWKFLLGYSREVSKIQDKNGKTTFSIKAPQSSFIIDNDTGLLELSTETIDEVTRTSKLVKAEDTLPPLSRLLPDRADYKQIHLDTGSPIIKQMIAQGQTYMLRELGKRPEVQQQLLNKHEDIKAKLRKKYFDMLDFNEIDQAILADLPDIKHSLRKSLAKSTQGLHGQKLTDILEYFSSNDEKRLEIAETIIAGSIQNKDIQDHWNTSLLGHCLNLDPDHGEGMFLISSTIRDAFLSAYLELETYKAIDAWVADDKAKQTADQEGGE